MAWLMISIYFSEKLDLEKFKRIEFPNFLIGYCEGTLRSSKSQIMRANATA